MPDSTLTQEQIDALFNEALGDEDSDDGATEKTDNYMTTIEERKIKPHDFKNPKIFPKENIRMINLVHENYAKYLSSYMSSFLRTECSLSVVSVEELKYIEYRDVLPNAVMLAVLELAPIDGNILLDIRRETCYTIIDRLLGGTGESMSVGIPDDFSDIELKILEGFCEQIIGFFRDAWVSVAEVTPTFKKIETNSRLTQLMALEESVIVVAMEIKILEYTSTVSVCLPCIGLEDVLSNTSIYMMNSRRRSGDPAMTKESILNNLKTSKVDIRGILGTTSLTLQDLLQLQVGDVIPLDKPVDNPVVLKIGPKNWFDGEIGVKKNKMAVKIKNVLQYIQ